MEPLMTSLEGAIQLLSTSPSTFQVPIGRPSTQPPQFLKLFQKDCETFRQELQVCFIHILLIFLKKNQIS